MEKLVLPAIHLVALLGFIFYKVKSPFVQFMKDRYQEVYDGLNRSKIQAAEVDAKKKEIETKLASLDSTRQKIAGEWSVRQSEQTRSIQDNTQRVISQMNKEAEQNKKAFENGLQQLVLKNFSKTVLTQAETKIKQGLTPEAQKSLNDRFAQELSHGGAQ